MRNLPRTVLIWSGHLFVPFAFCISTDIFCARVLVHDVSLLLGVRVVNRSFRRPMGREVFTYGWISPLFFPFCSFFRYVAFFLLTFFVQLRSSPFGGGCFSGFFFSPLNCWYAAPCALASVVAVWAEYLQPRKA